LSEVRKETVLHGWGGSTATFFTYLHFSHDLCTSLLTALLPLIRASLGLNYLQSGLLLSAFTITSGLSQFPGGWIGDRFSRHIIIATGLTGVGLTCLAVGLSPTYYPMLVILIVMGIFSGAYHPSALSILSSHIETTRRGKAIALHMVGGSIGFAIGPIFGGLIAELLGWRFAFIILSIPALVAILLTLKRFQQLKTVANSQRETRLPPDDGTNFQPRYQGIGILRVLRPVAIIFALAILTQFAGGTALAFIPIYLVDKHNITPAYAAILIGIVRGGGIAGSLFGGWLSDKWGRKKAIFLAMATTGPALYLLTQLPFNAGLITILFLFGMLMYMRQATVQPFLMDSTPSYLRATIFGIYFGLGMEGMSLMQPVAGYYMDIFGIISVFNVIALVSVALSVAALLLAKKA